MLGRSLGGPSSRDSESRAGSAARPLLEPSSCSIPTVEDFRHTACRSENRPITDRCPLPGCLGSEIVQHPMALEVDRTVNTVNIPVELEMVKEPKDQTVGLSQCLLERRQADAPDEGVPGDVLCTTCVEVHHAITETVF